MSSGTYKIYKSWNEGFIVKIEKAHNNPEDNLYMNRVSNPNLLMKRNLEKWFGPGTIPNEIKSDFDLINLSQRGIPKIALENLARNMGITTKTMVQDIFNLPVKTLGRKSHNVLLDRKTSSHAIEIALIMNHAFEVFEDENKIKVWINSPIRAFNNIAPVMLFDTLTGLKMVNNILTRIEEGVYS
jgi:putative toxin-antitoxin system antitoxin component (TIGR02293 family)